MRAFHAIRCLPFAALLCASQPTFSRGSDLVWAGGPEAATALARSEERVTFVTLLFEGERRSEQLLELLSSSKVIGGLAAETVNLVASSATHTPAGRECDRFPGLECSAHRDALEWAQAEFSLSAGTPLPMNLWLGIDGKVLLSVPFEIDESELAWCFATARSRAMGREPVLPEGSRPPRRLVLGHAYQHNEGIPFERGLSDSEVAENIKLLKSSNRPGVARLEANMSMLFANHEDAAEFAGLELGRGRLVWRGNESLESGLALIGRISPPPFAEVLEGYAGDPRAEVRNQAAVALEQLGQASSVKTVRSALSKEKDPRVEKNWIRALGATGYSDKAARKTLLKLATKEKDDLLRRNAIFALGYLLVDDASQKALIDRFECEDPLDREIAACAMALTRNGIFVDRLRARPDASEPNENQAVVQRALAILRGAPLHSIEEDVMRLCEDQLPRERVFFKIDDR